MDFLSIKDLDVNQIKKIMEFSSKIKENPDIFFDKLSKKNFVLIFQKPSNRTRVSFEVGINQMGGNVIHLGSTDIGFGEREPIKDIARVLSRYVDCIIARTYSHDDLILLKEFSSIPVINALSDLEHPCQALADIFTLQEKKLNLSSLKLAYLGDGNNVLNSLLFLCSKLGVSINMAIPEEYFPKKEVLSAANNFASESGSEIKLLSDPESAVKDADVLYTDVWISMGQEKEVDKRQNDFKNYQLNNKLVSLAKDNCLIMHCLPAHRGQEITDSVVESKNSIVFDQAENRLHVQKAILLWVLGEI